MEENLKNTIDDDLAVETGLVIIEPNDIIEMSPLSETQARDLTDTIRDTSEVLWSLLARAHSGKAWKALGYSSWESYVRTEFDMSRSRSYQILDQARVIAAIEQAVPEGTHVNISESAARDIKDYLEEAIPAIKEKTQGLKPEVASQVVNDVVEDIRSKPNVEDDLTVEDEQLGIVYGHPSAEEKAMGKEYEPAPVLPDPPAERLPDVQKVEPSVTPVDDIDIRQIRKNIGFSHDITSMIAAAAGLPEDLQEVIDATTEERAKQIDKNFDLAVERYNQFIKLWEERRNSEDTDNFEN